MVATIVVPLDGSALAERAVPYAARLATAAGARLILLHARSALAREEGPEYDLGALAAWVRADCVTVEPLVRRFSREDVSTVIRDTAQERQADLIVMSTHGRGGLGRWLYGSVADNVLRRADAPVVLVPAACEQTWPAEQKLRVLVALDGSELAEAALEPAAKLADAVGAELVLYRVVEPPNYALYAEAAPYAPFDDVTELAAAREYLDRRAAGLRDRGITVRTRASIGAPTTAIIQAASEERAGLIAMATHGRGGIARFVLGSVATGVLQRAHVPLLLVRPVGMPRRAAPPAPEAQSTPAAAAAEAEPTGPAVTLTLSPAELDLLERGLADLLYSQQQDRHLAGPARALLARLKQAEAQSTEQEAATAR